MKALPMAAEGPALLDPSEIAALSAEIRSLARARDAVILAHNYQLPEVQDVADFVGDSLALSQQAARTQASTIAFCGVHFMAETASILSPEKTVLIPDRDAGCSLSDSITAPALAAWKAEHPGAIVVMYVNTTAAVKALTDYCCTSSNAVAVVSHIYATHGEDTRSCSARTCSSAPTSSAAWAGACTSGTASVTSTRGSAPPTSRRRERPRPTPSS